MGVIKNKKEKNTNNINFPTKNKKNSNKTQHHQAAELETDADRQKGRKW